MAVRNGRKWRLLAAMEGESEQCRFGQKFKEEEVRRGELEGERNVFSMNIDEKPDSSDLSPECRRVEVRDVVDSLAMMEQCWPSQIENRQRDVKARRKRTCSGIQF
eukprot:763174-Hanusia_phi.AAC.1